MAHEWNKYSCYRYSTNVVCNNDRGNWFEVEGCADGFTNLDNDHYCLDRMECSGKAPRTDLNCCPDGRDRCRDTSHGGSWHFCTNNSIGEGDTCEDAETTDGRKKYKRCVCDKNIYKYTCDCSSLSGQGDSCTDDDGNTYYTACTCATYASEILTSNMDCSSCTGKNETGNCNIPDGCENESKPGYSCISGVISCEQCPAEYNKSCSEGISKGVGKKCGGGCFSEYCSTGSYATCSGCDTSYNLSSAVENANCSSCADENGTHYNCPSCKEGYHWEGSSCVIDCESTGYTVDMCTNGATFIETCTDQRGTTWGWCVDCKAVDWNGRVSDPHSPCAGYYYCGDDKVPSGKSCTCGDNVYYENCMVKTYEKCTDSRVYDDTPLGGCTTAVGESDSLWSRWGYYPVGKKCTQNDGTDLYCFHSCNSSSQNVLGKDAPQKGKKECDDDSGKNCAQCGGYWYCDECGETDPCAASGLYDSPEYGLLRCYGYEDDSYVWGQGDYKSVLKCTKQDGTNLWCSHPCNSTSKDQIGNDAPQAGKKECRDDTGINCEECGEEWYCDQCGEPCDSYYPYDDTALGSCYNAVVKDSYYFTSYGYYSVGLKCTTPSGISYYCKDNCNSTYKNELGEYAPQAGKEECKNGEGINCAMCGGEWFCDECADMVTCNYEYTEEYCASLDKGFEYKCSGNTGIRYGLCTD